MKIITFRSKSFFILHRTLDISKLGISRGFKGFFFSRGRDFFLQGIPGFFQGVTSFQILVFKNKKKLKGRPFLITENLTEKRYKLYTDVSTELGRKNVWTAEGRIFAMINKSKKLITSIEDISEP